MNALICFVSLVNSACKSWNVVPSIRFSSYIEVILCKFRVLFKEYLKWQFRTIIYMESLAPS
jgi:hypothetical protein